MKSTSFDPVSAKLIFISPLDGMPNEFDSQCLPPRLHHKPTEHGGCCIQDNQLPTKSHVESENVSFEAVESLRKCEMCIAFVPF
jgi:hypothetical protein